MEKLVLFVVTDAQGPRTEALCLTLRLGIGFGQGWRMQL